MPTGPTRVETQTFDEVFADRWRPLVQFAALTTGSVSLAEEIVQDAFVDLCRSWHEVENPAGWLRIAVLNRCRRWVRRQELERRHSDATDDAMLPDESIAIRDALHALSPRQRAAVVLRFYDDLPEAEIARLLDCRPGTVKSLLSRALRTLRKDLS